MSGGLPRPSWWLGLAAAVVVLALARPVLAREEWVPVRDVSLIVQAGSPLDFSHMFAHEAAGSAGRVIAGPDGRLAFEQRPRSRAALHCASLAWSPASGGFPDQATADIYAEQLRRHGYNIARFHFLDATLMTGRTADFDFDPEQLERFRYLMAALKREGIYWIIDVMTSPNGAIGNVTPDRWTDRYNLKVELYTDARARQHWRHLAETLLGTLNPHTRLKPIEDPALAALVLVNENGLEFDGWIEQGRSGKAYPPLLQPRFNAWLVGQYKSSRALKTAWAGSLAPRESLEAGSVTLPAKHSERGPRMRDAQLFFRAMEAEHWQWLSQEIRALGYQGLITAFNNTTIAAAQFTRAALPLVSMNTYFDEVLSFEPGVSIGQKSSLDDELGYLRAVFASRWQGRPFLLTEFDHLFWNRYRHESGLAVPAYAALQGWDAICRHGTGPIDLTFNQPWPHKRAILPYGIGLDPVARAGETLAVLLLRRGDVAPARSHVVVPFGKSEHMLEDGTGQIPSSVTSLGLLTGLGLLAPDAPLPAAPGTIRLELSPGDSPQGAGARALDKVSRMLFGAAGDGAANVKALKASGILPAANRTDPVLRLYESDTGEILLDPPFRYLQVVTPRTEAATFDTLDKPRKLGVMRLEQASGPALLALSALDGAAIRESRRLLLIFATDAMNTDMTFRDGERRTIVNYGRMPVLIRRETVRLRLAFGTGHDWKLSSLHLDGSRGSSLIGRLAGAEIEFTLDNAATDHGPTTFFLLQR